MAIYHKFLPKNDYLLSMIAKGANLVFGFLSIIFLNRFLGPTLKGEYSSILNIVSIISAIAQLGISSVYSQFKRKNIHNCFYVFISLSIILAILYSVVGLLILVFFHFQLDLIYLVMISIISIFAAHLRYINLVENMRYNTVAVIIMSIANFLMSLYAFLVFDKNLYLALTIYIVKDLIIILILGRKIKKKNLFRAEYVKHYKKILQAGILPMLSTLLIMLNYRIDILMLDIYNIDYTFIGIYSLGLSIAEYTWVIPDIFKDVIQKRSATDNSLKSINFSLRMATALMLMILVAFIIFGNPLFELLFGKAYDGAYQITIILFIGIFSMSYYKIIGQMLIADGKSRQYFSILFSGAIMNIVSNMILIPPCSIYGAAFASIFSYSFIGLIFLVFYLKTYHIHLKDVIFMKASDVTKIKNLFKNKILNNRKNNL